MKKKTQINKTLEIYKKDAELEPDVLPYSKTIEPLRITAKCVLKGLSTDQIKLELKLKGFDCNIDKVYRLVRIAKKQILRRAERDLDFNYKWVEENLKEMHYKCIETDDDNLRLKVIDKLMQLWGLNVQRVESVNMEITPAKIAEYENLLFG